MVKKPPAMQGDPGLIPGSGQSYGEGIGYPLQYSWASLVAQLVKNPPAMWETWLWSLGREDHLEKGKATHPSILAWRIPWTIRVRHNWATFTFTFHSDRCEVVPVCNFDLHLSNDQRHWADYFLSIGHLGVFFGKCLFRSPTPFFFKWVDFFFYWVICFCIL